MYIYIYIYDTYICIYMILIYINFLTTTTVRTIVIKIISIPKIMKFCSIPLQFLFDNISDFNKLCG